jgi:beta-N-acetylhexosaminidase
VLATWSVQRLAEQTLVMPVDENSVGSVRDQVAAGAGGLLLLGASAPADLASALAAVERAAPGGIVPLVMTDEEGGAIQRMANLVGTMPSAREMATTISPAQIQALATQVGRRMKALGVSMDLAPVLDLDGGAGPDAADPDGTRSFSTSAAVAGADGLAFAAGLEAAGVIPVAKHFPGLGGATANPDLAVATTQPWSALQGGGLLPFASAVRAGIPAIMVTGAAVPGLSAQPASLSPAVVTGLLRTQLHFTGLVLTDALTETTVTAAGYSLGQAAVAALRAGADMLLFNGQPPSDNPALAVEAEQAVVAAVQGGSLPRSRLESAVLRILASKHVDLCH